MEKVEAASCRFAKRFPNYLDDFKAPRPACKRLENANDRIAPVGHPAKALHRSAGRRGRMPRLRGTIFARDDQVWKKHGEKQESSLQAAVGVQPSGCGWSSAFRLRSWGSQTRSSLLRHDRQAAQAKACTPTCAR